MDFDLSGLDRSMRAAVRQFWATRHSQSHKQLAAGTADQGARGAVTGGKQMDGFVKVLCELIVRAGVPDACVFRNKAVELPGYFRPTKQWDLLVVSNHDLLAVIELKSQVGPSFGNNFNNRTEEAMGSELDVRTSNWEGAFATSPRPWPVSLVVLDKLLQAKGAGCCGGQPSLVYNTVR
jgi:hypothetical protein